MSRARDRADGDFAGKELIFDADGDTSITADTDDQIDIKINGSDQIKLASDEVVFNEQSIDVDFRVESNGNANMLFVDGGNDVIGIKTATPTNYYADDLVVTAPDEGGMTIVSGTAERTYLAFADGTSGDARYRGFLNYDHNTDTLGLGSSGGTSVEVDTNKNVTLTTGNLVIGTSGKGIDFSAVSHASGMSSELLDSYEEGTFTPAADSFSGTMTFTTARYVKIGKLVHVNFKMTSDGNSDTSQIAISGFPFSAVGEHPVSLSYNTAGSAALHSANDPTIPNAMINTAEIMYVYVSTGGAFKYSSMGTGFIRVSGTYITA